MEEYFAVFVEKLPDIADLPDKSILLIIGDPFFLDLPLEAVSWFKNFQLCRDFSTQLHQNRVDRFGKENSIPKGKIIGIADNTENRQMIRLDFTKSRQFRLNFLTSADLMHHFLM